MKDERSLAETDITTVIDKPLGGKKSVIMDSQILTSLMKCPRLTDFRFNLNLISMDGKSNSLECGSIVHKFLEVYYNSQIQGLTKSQAEGYGYAAANLYIQGCKLCTDFHPFASEDPVTHEVTEVIKPVCGHKVNEYPGTKNTPKDSEGYKLGYTYVLDTIAQYLEYWKNDYWVPLEAEVTKGRQVYEDDDIRVIWKAKIDLVVDTNKGIYPEDHKTMKQNKTTLSLNNQFMGQALLMGTQGVIINKIGFQKTLEPKEKFLRPMVNFSTERLLEWQSETLPYYAKLLIMYAENGYFPPNYESCEGRYGNCSFTRVCEGNPTDRERLLKEAFTVGAAWDISNDEPENGD
jgi:hypothetical protein